MEIPFAKAEYGQEEKDAVNDVLNSNFLASGPQNETLEREFAEYIGTKYAVCVNSGSSANLLALASLNLPKGSKVLTSACGFPATLSPIIHLGLIPVLVDYDLVYHNIDIDQIQSKAFDVKAVILAHTLGNVADVWRLKYLQDINVPIIEDCCEAVGSQNCGQKVGSIGTLGTFSFYPAHQITALGGGGMVTTDDINLYKRMKSLRDWGKMYDWDSSQGGNRTDYCSPIKYHRGYTYETIGWNFKLPEANAAFGRVQLKKVDAIRNRRMEIHNYLRKNIFPLGNFMIPSTLSPKVENSWFGFCMTIKESSFIKRNEFGKYLEEHGIRHRPFFAGNILRQPAFLNDEAEKFPIADKLMKDSLFVGCWPGMTQEMLDYIVEKIGDYCLHP